MKLHKIIANFIPLKLLYWFHGKLVTQVKMIEIAKTHLKCLSCKKGYLNLTNKKDKKGLTIYICPNCRAEAV